MDLPSKNMYDTFKDDIWKELGPLDPDWFEALTAQTLTNEGNVSDQDDLCGIQEGNFKTPSEKTAVESQLFSTPKVFRHSRVVSPETEDEQSSTTPQEKGTLPWTATQSPDLFWMTKEGVRGVKYGGVHHRSLDSFDLLHSPQKTPVSYANHISESLGAQIHPDMSWTSSLNTPPAIPSTLILTKPDESTCPVNVSADKNVVFVRKLFPSLPNASGFGEVSPNDKPSVHQGVVSPVAAQNPEPLDSPRSSVNESDCVWRQKLPDAIEDGEIRSTVASVLDGAEDVLSIFFTNSSSALRKVKTDRIKKRQMIPKTGNGLSSTDISVPNTAVCCEERTADQEPGILLSPPPVKTGDIGDSQWSPLSLSEIPLSTVNTSCHENGRTTQVESSILTEQLTSGFDSGQVVKQHMTITHTGLTKKKRKFVYTVEPSKVQGACEKSHKMDLSSRTHDSGQDINVKQLVKTPDEAECCSIAKNGMEDQGNVTEEKLPPSVQEKVQDLDISQLSRDFAQDFTQMPEPGKLSKVAENTPGNVFSPSACLSAMKRSNQQARQANLHYDFDRSLSTTNQNTTSDSGFQSAVADLTHLTASSVVIPGSVCNGESQQWTGFKTDIQESTYSKSTILGNGGAYLDNVLPEPETDAQMSSVMKKNETLAPGRLSEVHMASTSTKLRFQTTSNKGFQVSSANLDGAKHLFEETGGEKASHDQTIKHAQDELCASRESVKLISNQLLSSSENRCQLTASQKADVTELCTLLEEANSQFEFTQFKTTKLKQHFQDNLTSHKKPDKELDPDCLVGIDFDDSFNSDPEKHLEVIVTHDKMTAGSEGKTPCETSNILSESSGLSLSGSMRHEDSSTKDMPSSSKHISEGRSSIKPAETKSLDRAGHTETSRNPLRLGVGFKTEGGNVLRVSKKCLGKAKALFEHSEENLVTSEKSPDKQRSVTDAETQHKCTVDHSGNFLHSEDDGEKSICTNRQVPGVRDEDGTKGLKKNKMDTTKSQSGFQMASGKGICISTKALQEADAFFGDCDITVNNADLLVKKSIEPLSVGVGHKRSLQKLTNVQGIKVREPVDKFENVNVIPAACHTEVAQRNEITVADSRTPEDTNKPVKQNDDALRTGHPANQIRNQAPRPHIFGFQTASGKGVTISSDALKKAKSLLSECEGVEDAVGGKPIHFKIPAPVPPTRNGGFLAASGKPVAFSSEALQKAKALFSDIPLGEEMAAVPHAGNVDKKRDHAENMEKMHCGFSTAGGARVHVSQKNLLKAKDLLKECDDGSMSKKTASEADDFFNACNSGNVSEGSDTNDEKMLRSDVTINGRIHKNFLDSTERTSENGNPSLMPRPSLMCTKSKDVGRSSGKESRNAFEFCTVSRKKDESMTKAKSLLNESDTVRGTNIQSKQKDLLPSQTGGFQTASGKGVNISSDALKKAKSLLSECEGVEDAVGGKPTHFKIPVPVPPTRNGGFLAASGKPVAFSSEALQKAKALFSDIPLGEEMAAVPHAGNVYKKQDHAENMEKMHCGFSTAGGARVHVSQKNLLKAKDLLKECDDGSVSKKTASEADGFFNACNSGNVSEGSDTNDEKMLRSDVTINGRIHKNFLDSTERTSENGNPSLMPRPSLMCTKSKDVGRSSGKESRNAVEFCTVSRKKDESMTKAKVLLNESDTVRGTNIQSKQKDPLPPQTGGFQPASGKGVNISSAALKRAKTLFSECEGVEDAVGGKPTHFKIPVPVPPTRNGGFFAASGKPVAFSSEALQKAKALFSDIPLGEEMAAVPHAGNVDKKRDHAENMDKMHCGFSTAGGARVHVSQKNLLKAKDLLKECDDRAHDSISFSTSLHDTHESKLKNVRIASNSNLSSDKDKSPPQVVETLTSGSICIGDRVPTKGKMTPTEVGDLHGGPGEEIFPKNQTEAVKRSEESSLLYFQPLNLSGCTETQQKFLAQEALDCTKALLEDEDLAGQTMALERMPFDDYSKTSDATAEEHKEKRKRLVEEPDMTSQPPLKRRLLEEFDRTVDSPRGSALHPEKSIPDGLIKDRRVFKYSTSLHPNITRPHGSGNNYTETRLQSTTQHCAPADRRAAHSKISTFVPPFLKNAKTESHKTSTLKDNIRTPSAFVPPFKKQRTIVQETSPKPQEEEDKLNTYTPPAKKAQSSMGVPGNNCKVNIQTVADTMNENLMTSQNLPVGSVDAATEASCSEKTLFRSQDMFQNLHTVELARDMQDMRIRKKKRQTIRPLPGSLFLTKTSGVSRIPFKVAVKGKPPGRYTPNQLYSRGVHQHVTGISSETAESFRFSIQQFIKQEAFIDGGGVQLADGGWLIPRNDGTAGKEEFYRSLCDTPGVDPKLISEEWVYNHYRWIIWKQASVERSFPDTMGSVCLTPEQVLLQLKYRYDVEVDHSRRPALRRIMEKDDTAAKTLVLCVCGTVSRGHAPKGQTGIKTPGADAGKAETPPAVIWLTDGWYAIKAQLDEPLTAMLHKGRLAVGGKLIIHGAQLVGSQDACSPLEAPDSLMLKICANSSRPARWDSKLGFHRDPRPFLLPVSCLYSNGGPAGCVDVVILRSYPIQWMERKPDGGVVFRSVRAEEREARRYSCHKQKAMESLFAKIQAEFEKEEKGNAKPQRRRRTISRLHVASLQDGEELYEALGDDSYLEAQLSEQQIGTLHTYRRSLMEKKQAELQDRCRRALESAEGSEGSCPKRDVTPVWRLCVADSMDERGSVYQLNLWRPPSDLQSLLKEGCRYKVCNLSTSEAKKHGGRTTVQLTGTKKTQFQDLQASHDWLSTRFQPRVTAHFVDLQNPEFQPLCGEVDLAGYVISIIDGQGFTPAFYLADGKLNFVKVRCFSSLAQSGLEDVIKPHILLSLSNVQLRGQSTAPTPVVYAGDLTVFSTNPKEAHLQVSLGQLRSHIQSQESFFLTAEEKLSHMCDGLSTILSPALQTRTPAPAWDTRQDTKTTVVSQQPVRSLGSFTPVSRKPPAAASCSTEKDPSSLKRRRALDYLSRIPSPPPISLLSSTVSPCVKKTFIPPRRSGTPSTLQTVQTPAHKPVNSLVEEEWVNDEELAMIDTQALLDCDLT